MPGMLDPVIKVVWTTIAILRVGLMCGVVALGTYVLEKLDGSGSYVKATNSFGATCHTILFPFDALGFRIDLGTYGKGTKPSPQEVEEMQWGKTLSLYASEDMNMNLNASSGGDGYQNSWAYGSGKCTIDIVTSAKLSPRWLLLERIPGSSSKEIPMESYCGGDTPGPFSFDPKQFTELKWTLRVWILLRLCALIVEWATILGFAGQHGFFDILTARVKDVKREKCNAFWFEFVPPWEKLCCIKWPNCTETNRMAKKNKHATRVKWLIWFLLVLVPNVLLSPISDLKTNERCAQMVSTYYSPSVQEKLNYTGALQIVDFLIIAWAFRSVMQDREGISIQEEETIKENQFYEERLRVTLCRKGWLGWVVACKEPSKYPNEGNDGHSAEIEVYKDELYYPHSSFPAKTMRIKQMDIDKEPQIKLGGLRQAWDHGFDDDHEAMIQYGSTELLWRPSDGHIVEGLNDYGEEAEIQRRDSTEKYRVKKELLYPCCSLKDADALDVLLGIYYWFKRMAKIFLRMAWTLIRLGLPECYNKIFKLDCCQQCRQGCVAAGKATLGILQGGLMLMLCWCAALALLMWTVVVIQAPITGFLVSCVLFIWKLWLLVTKGFELSFALNFSLLLLFKHPTFDIAFNLNMFRVTSFLLFVLDFVALWCPLIAKLLRAASDAINKHMRQLESGAEKWGLKRMLQDIKKEAVKKEAINV